MKKHLFTLVILLLCFKPSFAENYTFGVVPQQSAQRLAQLWTPILIYLSEETDFGLDFRTAKNIPTFEQRLALGGYDFAYMNPYHYTVFSKSPGYKAIAKRKDQAIKGILVVPKDSPIQSINDLANKKLAFPSPAAFAASILSRAHLKQNNINFTPNYVSSHDSVYLTVSKKLLAAGGGVMRTFNNSSQETRDNLRILWTSDGYTPHAFAVHPRVPQAVVNSLQEKLLDMSKTEKGKALLNTIKIKNGITSASDDDWNDIRALRIDLLNDLN